MHNNKNAQLQKVEQRKGSFGFGFLIKPQRVRSGGSLPRAEGGRDVLFGCFQESACDSRNEVTEAPSRTQERQEGVERVANPAFTFLHGQEIVGWIAKAISFVLEIKEVKAKESSSILSLRGIGLELELIEKIRERKRRPRCSGAAFVDQTVHWQFALIFDTESIKQNLQEVRQSEGDNSRPESNHRKSMCHFIQSKGFGFVVFDSLTDALKAKN